MSAGKRRKLTFPVSDRDQQTIAHNSSSSLLRQAWKAVQALLSDGERVRVDWKKQQSGSVCAMLIEDELTLAVIIKGIVLHRAYDVTFWAEPVTAERPPFTPARNLF